MKLVEIVNQQQDKIPDIKKEQITFVEKVEGTTTTTFKIEVNTTEGKEKYIVAQNNKGVIQVIDYQPVPSKVIKLPNVVQPIHTEVTVDMVTGTETKVTNDTKVISNSKEIQAVVAELEKTQIVDKKSTVVSAVVKNS